MHDIYNLKLEVLKADAVVIATGGCGVIFKKSTNSTFCTGAANGRLFRQGMKYANGEFIQIHPTAIPGQDKLRLISESSRGEGGRVWVYGDSSKQIAFPDGSIRACGSTGEPWYFLEEMYPAFGNLVPRDIGAREILRICEMGLGVKGEMQVYLDVSHLPNVVQHKLDAVLDIYQKFTGVNPRKLPMKIFPAVHYTMGGGWIDWPAADDLDREQRFRQMTNLKGCFNIGESDYQFHGANRLGANSLLSCIFSGLVSGVEIPRYLSSLEKKSHQVDEGIFTKALEKEQEKQKELFARSGKENVHKLHDELSEVLVNNVTVKRNNKDLQKTYEKIEELQRRYQNISLDDKGTTLNKTYLFAHQFEAMLDLALVITKGALLRDEFRGSHYKEGFNERNDEKFLKTTIAQYDKKGPTISYEDVDIRHFEPVQRNYVEAKKKVPEIKNLPKNIKLPI